MVVTGTVINEITNEPIDGASITVVDGNGKSLGPGTAAKSNGEFVIQSDKLVGNFLLFTAVDYLSVMATTKLFAADDFPIVGMQPDPDALEPVTVTPRKKSNVGLWLILIAVVLLNK